MGGGGKGAMQVDWDSLERSHVSKEPITSFVAATYWKEHRYFKPVGLWYQLFREWEEFVNTDFTTRKGTYRTLLRVDLTDVLVIRSESELLKFTEEYLVTDSGTYRDCRCIDWWRVADDYAGIEIAPYSYSCRVNSATFWYYPWDVASGCVWREGVVEILGHEKIDNAVLQA